MVLDMLVILICLLANGKIWIKNIQKYQNGFCRVFWLCAFSLAIGFASYYITNIYEKWNSSPVIISFSPFDASISAVPFPAITICNMNQAKKTEAEKILKDG